MSAAGAQAPQSIVPAVANPRLGVFIERLPYGRQPPESDFVYEAARSDLFGVVERETQYGVNRYAAVDDTARCEELVRNAYGPGKIAGLGWVYRYTPFPTNPYDADVARGVCVSVEKIAAPSARYVVTRGGIRDSVSGEFLLPLGTLSAPEQIWAAFGLVRVNATLWDENGRKNDPASDQDLVRSLMSGEQSFRRAAINLLNSRVLGAPFISDKRAVLRQETGASVGAALIATGMLSAVDGDERRVGIMAAAAIPSDADALFPAILKALEEPANPLTEEQNMERQRLEKLNPGFGNSIIGSPEARPGYTLSTVFDAAAFAAAMYGPTYASAFVTKYGNHLGKIFRQEIGGIFPRGHVMVAATAPETDQIILSLFKDADAPGAKNREGLLTHAAAVIGSTRTIPLAVVPDLRKKCADTSLQARPFTPLFCDVQLARAGDADAFQRLIAILMTPPADTVDQARNSVAQQMLLNLGPKGIEGLKMTALSSQPADAKPMLRWLCNLGTAAGPEIVARAKANSELMQDDASMKNIAAACENSSPNEIVGRFVLLWNAS